MSNFKVFNTIEKLMKLYEADEDPTAIEGGDAGADATEPPPTEGGDMGAEGGDPTADPEAQANADQGTFMSDNQKAEMAQLLIQALQKEPPAPGEIPEDKLNANTNNADDIINFVRSLVALNTSLSLDDETNGNTMAAAMKEI